MYKRIKISFINAGSITIDEGDWDDYDLCDGFIIIKKGEAWVAMYNAKEVFSVVLEKRGADHMITIGKHPEMSHDELQAYWEHANHAYPDECGTVDIEFDGEFVDLTYNFKERCDVPFQRIRRITGYLVGDLGRFNNAKRREVDDRVKHMGV